MGCRSYEEIRETWNKDRLPDLFSGEIRQKENQVHKYLATPCNPGTYPWVTYIVSIYLYKRLSVLASSHAAEAALPVEACLLALGAEEASVPQFTQYAGALHRGLEPL